LTYRQIIDRHIGCGAIDALRLLARWGFYSRYGQITLAGASLPEPFFGAYISSGIFFYCLFALLR
jgi:hypothetical protein